MKLESCDHLISSIHFFIGKNLSELDSRELIRIRRDSRLKNAYKLLTKQGSNIKSENRTHVFVGYEFLPYQLDHNLLAYIIYS